MSAATTTPIQSAILSRSAGEEILETAARLKRLDHGEDVTAPKTRKGRNMNQSLISMIASVSINATLPPFEASSRIGSKHGKAARIFRAEDVLSQRHTTISRSLAGPPFDQRLLKSTPALQETLASKRHISRPSDPMLRSQILTQGSHPEPDEFDELYPEQSAMESHGEPTTSDNDLVSSDNIDIGLEEVSSSTSDAVSANKQPAQPSIVDEVVEPNTSDMQGSEVGLPERLAAMFGLEKAETIIADLSLKGYMYLMEQHLCFYAYLPRRSVCPCMLSLSNNQNKVLKAGNVFKRGKQNPNYKKYWFILKADALSYYTDRSDLYFPRDTIDLRSGVSTSIGEVKDGFASFTIVTPTLNLYFRCESSSEAEEWVSQIRKVTFRSHHTGDSVKICIPLKDVIDIDDQQVTEAGTMLSIKVMGRDESYTVDEYFFSLPEGNSATVEALRRSTAGDGFASSGIAELEDVELGPPVHKAVASDVSSSGMQTTPDQSGPKVKRPVRPSSALKQIDSFSSISSLYAASADKIRQASSVAGVLRRQSTRVGNRLALGSREYYEKMTTMWNGKNIHYDDNEAPEDDATDEDDATSSRQHGQRFREHFGLPLTEKLQATYYSYMQRGVPVYGKIYVGSTKMILPLSDVENVAPEKGFRFGFSGLVMVVRGHEELFFEFRQASNRDDCAKTLLGNVDSLRSRSAPDVLSDDSNNALLTAQTENELLEKARRVQMKDTKTPSSGKESPKIIFDDPFASILDFKPPSGANITCLTIGSRGDVQPYIALCKALLREGHHPVIATHAEFEPWIRSHGIEFRLVAGDPAAIMALCVENDMFTPGFLREGYKFRGMLAEVFESSWTACQDADILIESPSALAGIHIAERLEVPYYRAFTMPWTRTRAFPHAFAVLNQRLGGNWNWYSYSMIEHGLWTLTGDLINKFRVKTLGLPKTTLRELRYDEVPFLYNFSPSVVAPPLDFGPNVHITGYWFLDEGENFTPPEGLVEFIKKARFDGKKLVYIGFGSITLEDPAALTRAIADAIAQADVRCILCKGWSDRLDKTDATFPEVALHEGIFSIKAVPHDWLFHQVDAAAHHGGAGTTGASLRAGIPTLVKPFFGDQHFFATRVEDLGVGITLNKINSQSLSEALKQLISNERIITRAKALGELIRKEDGVHTAIQTIYRDLEYARSLIKPRKAREPAEASDDGWTLLDDDAAEGPQQPTSPPFKASLASAGHVGYDDTTTDDGNDY